MGFQYLQQIVDLAKEQQKEFWEIILEEDCKERNVSKEESMKTMHSMYLAMKKADASYDPELHSASGMVGGDGAKLEAYRLEGKSLFGEFLSEIMEKAVKMGESNACMKRIVAAPTAGSCGVLPAVLLTYEAQKHVSEETVIKALYVAAGIGEVIAESASIAGAEGGCQAEIGSASSMSAGAVAFLEGGDAQTIIHASALALKNMLGLTCDPVAGLVEVPCVKRNVSGAVNAIVSAQMALAGIRSVIPPDEVIDSMRRIGKLLPACLRETGGEGLATTPTAQKITKALKL